MMSPAKMTITARTASKFCARSRSECPNIFLHDLISWLISGIVEPWSERWIGRILHHFSKSPPLTPSLNIDGCTCVWIFCFFLGWGWDGGWGRPGNAQNTSPDNQHTSPDTTQKLGVFVAGKTQWNDHLATTYLEGKHQINKQKYDEN